MKNKVVTALLMATVMFGLTACGGSAVPSASDLTNRGSDTQEDDTAQEETEGEDTEEEETEVKEEVEEEEEVKTASGIVFGSDEAKGYTGFEYLMEELVSTSNTKSGDKASFSVFVPDGDYPSVSGGSARCERMGVTVEVDVDPYLQYKWEDYTMRENLEEYVDGELYSDYYGLEIGEIEELGDDCAICEVTYLEYSSYDSTYTPYYELFCLRDMGDNVMAVIDIRIEAEETTGKTQSLLDEVSSFYELDINWDESFAETKKAAFENSDEYNADAFNLGYISFELPDGWDKDESESTYDEDIFGPNGDAYGIGYISVAKDYAGEPDMIDDMLSDIDYTTSYFEEAFGDDVSNVVVEDAGETFLGRTLKIEMHLEEEDGYDLGIFYLAQDNYVQYAIYAVVWAGEGPDAETDVRAALDKLFETGVLR
ncbi:MAG: hypothetical protein NC314_04020 [Roseburia sp.]|nr:hypothetical protein [Ruminococcus sp.]MCM1154094.1 hypothetical protein [Roseburia sp.]MCM1241984.1 hypothetical protein [Roseburia sp.]